MKRLSKISLFAMAGASFGIAADAGAADKDKLMQVGQTNYVTCMACHGPDGKGLDVGPLKMAPPLGGSKLATAPPEIAALIVLKGIEKQDAKYAGLMAPLGAALDDEKLAGVLTYVRNSFGNSGDPVTADEVAKVREESKERTAPLKRAELDEMLKKIEEAEKEGEGGKEE